MGNAKASKSQDKQKCRSCAFCVCTYTKLIMANWQDIRALEERIYEQIEEFLNNQEAYAMPVLNVYLDHDDMTYKAAAEDGLQGTEDESIYPMPELIRMGDNGKPEPDIDKISDVANSWIFLD